MLKKKKKHHLLRLDSRVGSTQIDGAFILNCQKLGTPSIYKVVYSTTLYFVVLPDYQHC